MIATVLYTLTCGSILMLAFISFVNPGKVNKLANQWLALFLFSVGCALLDRLIYDFHLDAHYSFLPVLTEFSRLAMAPALYLSVLHFTSPRRRFNRTQWLHFIPWLLFFIFSLSSFLQSFGKLIYPLPQPVAVNGLGIYAGLAVFYSVKIQMVMYWILSYIRLKQHQKNIQLFASTVEPINLKWLRYFLLGIVFMVFLWFNEVFFKNQLISAFAPMGILGATYCIGYFSLRQEEIFPFEKKDISEIREIIREEKEHALPKQQRLSSAQVEKLKIELQHLVETEKVFLDPSLDLPQLAQKMRMTSHELSYLLNEGMGQNFFEFINTYRVEEAKELLLSEKHRHLNILGIAYEAGFGSKTTFNTTFKKITGLSPTQFQRTAPRQKTSTASK